ncbi:hypothetical protein NLM33_40725 [Bradyrhizobium sp. CCGUVB1N3]|uniref:hypothetical protein n=1 Tax=Bradyrhizobium sp. CCGUVB1N3 TaxID=2949629 RepID=UPI0020B26012|nr:hypothetical protein [Bradyrhizobium sp. CCGUVB1N3]MCP3476534.1 hypothetical protein [Bradyrhizobium sp. CCGUVB1N3]
MAHSMPGAGVVHHIIFDGYSGGVGRLMSASARKRRTGAGPEALRLDAQERHDRRFALRLICELVQVLPWGCDGAELLVEDSLPLWKYDGITAMVSDDDDL